MFHKYGNEYSLAQVWTAGQDVARNPLSSKKAIEIARSGERPQLPSSLSLIVANELTSVVLELGRAFTVAPFFLLRNKPSRLKSLRSRERHANRGLESWVQNQPRNRASFTVTGRLKLSSSTSSTVIRVVPGRREDLRLQHITGPKIGGYQWFVSDGDMGEQVRRRQVLIIGSGQIYAEGGTPFIVYKFTAVCVPLAWTGDSGSRGKYWPA